MKGLFFQRPLEFRLLVDGESWRQGDTVKGTLIVKNQGTSEVQTAGIGVWLAHAAGTKVAQKKEDAFTALADRAFSEPSSIAPGADVQMSWEFPLDVNCPITDKSKSLYLVYGQGNPTPLLGQLQLKVQPFQAIQDYLAILNTEFRFVIKSMKSSKGYVEVKLEPPTAKAYVSVEGLTLSCRIADGKMEFEYDFEMKKVQAGPASMKLDKSHKNYEFAYAPNEYLLQSGRFNYVRIEQDMKAMLDQVGSGISFV